MAPSLASGNISITPDISSESDIVDQRYTADRELAFDHHEIPSRPTSRLGFNRVRIRNSHLMEEEFIEDVQSEALFEAEALEPSTLRRQVWTRPAHVDMEHDITTLMSKRDNASRTYPEVVIPSSCDSSNSPNDVPTDDEDIDAELDSDYSSCDESDDESDTTFLFPRPDPPSTTTEALFSHALEESDWSLRPKYSCLPSPLSPRHAPPYASAYHHTPPRHRYRHHGHSRHALLHLKWFWATREESWMEYKARQCEAKAYDGLSIFSSVSPGLRLPSECPTLDPADTPRPPSSSPMPHLPPLSVHPRRGDLRALRDPYCMHIDRYFVGMPVWTMAKTLWMFDVHMASGDLGVQKDGDMEEPEEDLFEEDRSESESIETSGSHAFSDDSDSTLVESESEQDVPRCANRARDTEEACADVGKGCPGPYPGLDSASSTCQNKGKCESDFSASSQAPSTNSKLHPQPAPRSRWATSWYHRWEVLMQLCIENNPAIVADPDVPPTASAPPAKSQRFFIVDDWSDAVADEEGEEDQEEEMSTSLGNVLVVVNDDSSDGRPLRRCRF